MDYGWGGAQGHADADFLGLAGDGIGDYAVDAEGGEDQAQGGEDGYEVDEEFARGDGVIDKLLDWL